MRKIGDKIYIALNKDTVVAIEKLSVTPEEMGMRPIEEEGVNPQDHIRLSEVWDIFGAITEMNVREPGLDSASMKELVDLKKSLVQSGILKLK